MRRPTLHRRPVLLRDLFKREPLKLQQLIHMREVMRFSTPRLAEHFGVDRTTIRYTFVRFAPHLLKLPPEEKKPDAPPPLKQSKQTYSARLYHERKQVEKIAAFDWVAGIEAEVQLMPQPPAPKPADKYAHLVDEPINPGRDYIEYRGASAPKRRNDPEAKAFKERLAAEHKERLKRRGSLLTQKDRDVIARAFSDGSLKPPPRKLCG